MKILLTQWFDVELIACVYAGLSTLQATDSFHDFTLVYIHDSPQVNKKYGELPLDLTNSAHRLKLSNYSHRSSFYRPKLCRFATFYSPANYLKTSASSSFGIWYSCW